MGWVDLFEEEKNFESTVKDAVNLELQVASTVPKMQLQVSEPDLKIRLKKLWNKANVQLQRLEELCDLYDIPLMGRSSIDVEAMLNQMDDLQVKEDGKNMSKKDILETAREMENKEEVMLNNALLLARKLGYSEAVDILNTTISGPKFFNDGTNSTE
jgi:ferritin-like metal-binding protein YciE